MIKDICFQLNGDTEDIASKKNKLLQHLRSQNAMGFSSSEFFLNKCAVCIGVIHYLTKLSPYVIKNILKDHSEGLRFYRHGQTGIKKSLRAPTLQFVCWLKNFAEFFGQYSPDTNQVVLSHWLNKSVLYDMYVEETPSPCISIASFYQNFKVHFGVQVIIYN